MEAKIFDRTAFLHLYNRDLVSSQLCEDGMTVDDLIEEIIIPVFIAHKQFKTSVDMAQFLLAYGQDGLVKLNHQLHHTQAKASAIDMLKQQLEDQLDMQQKELDGLLLLYNIDPQAANADMNIPIPSPENLN